MAKLLSLFAGSTGGGVPKGPEAALGLPGLPAPDPGNVLYAQKVTKKAPGRPRSPVFVQSVGIREDTQLPLNFQLSLVTSAVHYALRLTALGLGDFAGFYCRETVCSQ